MLAEFKVERTFNKIKLRVYVDCDTQLAEVTVTYDRIYKGEWSVNFAEVATPELAERYLVKPCDKYGSLIESLEIQYRQGWGVGAENMQLVPND